jgi:DNA-directed RNA polymerase subunit alpha
MTKITCVENYIDKERNHYSCFLIEPLDAGQGITLGNSLRRTLLSDLTGFTITGARINNLKHEFASIQGLREDTLEVLLNLKEIILKIDAFSSVLNPKAKLKAYLNVKGPIIVTAGMFKLANNQLQIINPHQYICTILDTSEFYCEVDIEQGKGYRLVDELRRKDVVERLSPTKPTTLFMDANFNPIRRVNFKIKLIHDTFGNLKESLIFEIVTNASVTPKRCLQESLKLLITLFLPLLSNPDFLLLSSELFESFFIY